MARVVSQHTAAAEAARLVPLDKQPAGGGCTTFGTVLCSDVMRPVEVGVQRVAIDTTHEQATRTAVVAGSMPTSAAYLRCGSRIRDQRSKSRRIRLAPNLLF